MAYTVSVANGCSGATPGLPGIGLGDRVLRFQESADDSSHIFGMSIILVLSMSQVARDIMTRSLGKRSSLYAGLSETHLRPFPQIGTLTRTRSNEEKKTPPRQFFFPVTYRLDSYRFDELAIDHARDTLLHR